MTILTIQKLYPRDLNLVTWHKKIFTLIKKWNRNASTRKSLHSLSDHQLEDIGLTRQQAEGESKRPFWR